MSINYRGRVQGVGFRWNVKQIADNFPCSGYVKNLADGSVDVVLEGKRSDLNNCISLIEQRMRGKNGLPRQWMSALVNLILKGFPSCIDNF